MQCRPLTQEEIAHRRELAKRRHAEKLAASQGKELSEKPPSENSPEVTGNTGDTKGVWYLNACFSRKMFNRSVLYCQGAPQIYFVNHPLASPKCNPWNRAKSEEGFVRKLTVHKR